MEIVILLHMNTKIIKEDNKLYILMFKKLTKKNISKMEK